MSDDEQIPVSQPPTPSTYPALWYTSGTPHRRGLTECPMARYLGTHAGVHGTGHQRIATAVPLATGAAVHRGVQLIGQWVIDFQAAHPVQRLLSVPDEVIAWAAGEAARAYEAKARKKGLLLTNMDVDSAAANEILILEQRTLIESLIWIYAIVRLTFMLARARILAVELECAPVIDCTCGVGDWVGQDLDHAARGCTGIVAQGRGDVLFEVYEDGTIEYEEIKTKATERKSWEDAWEHSGQLWLNTEAASRRLGKDVNTSYVPILFKGWRGRDKGRPTTDPKYQHSELCYGWLDVGVDGQAHWASQYKWVDDYGKGHTLGSSYRRHGLWIDDVEIPLMEGVRADAGRVERWIKGIMSPMQQSTYLRALGPFPRQQMRMPEATMGFLAEERLWRYRVDLLRSQQAYDAEHPTTLALVPRAWQCTRYDGALCDFKPVCDKEPGFESIDTMGRYEIRTPHHAPEKAAWEAAGLLFPHDPDEEFDDED